MIRLLIFGGRRFRDLAMLARSMKDFVATVGRPDLIITGAASGADFLGGELAKSWGVPLREFPAEWTKFGNDAGPIRNQQMLDEGRPTHGLAMPGGPGTADMLLRLHWAGIPVTLGV